MAACRISSLCRAFCGRITASGSGVIISDEGDLLTVGGAMTLKALASHDRVRQNAPLLYEAAQLVGTPQVRALATLGGNLSPIGASANITAIGILRKNGYDVKAGEFMRISVPFTLVAVLSGYLLIWLFFRPGAGVA